MSWSARFVVRNGEFTEVGPPSNVDVKHHKDQFKVAKRVATSLIKSKAFGDPEGAYDVTFSGHGNEGHVPTDGWADDFINIGLSQKRDEV